jgi:Mor transcription activator family
VRISLEKVVEMFPQSIISEFYKVFGPENTEKLMTVFGGTKLEVPNTQDLENVQREIAIYESVKRAHDPQEKRRLIAALAQQYDIPKRRVNSVFRMMRRQQALAEKLKKAEKSIGQHRKTKLKPRKKPRKLRMR